MPVRYMFLYNNNNVFKLAYTNDIYILHLNRYHICTMYMHIYETHKIKIIFIRKEKNKIVLDYVIFNVNK